MTDNVNIQTTSPRGPALLQDNAKAISLEDAPIQFLPTSHICLSDVDYANAVTPWLRAHPEAADMSVEDGTFLALNKLYRCGAPNNC